MTAILDLPRPDVSYANDPFALEVTVHTDIAPGAVNMACGTSDGCGSTCASACITSAE